MANRYLTLTERFWLKVKKPTVAGAPVRWKCWKWTGTLNANGYGRIIDKGVRRQASRVAYELFNGQITPGLTIDHVCRNRWCVNPGHLQAVSNRENVTRGIGPSAVNARKTKCPQGHAYNEINTRVGHGGKRQCRACDRARWSKRHG